MEEEGSETLYQRVATMDNAEEGSEENLKAKLKSLCTCEYCKRPYKDPRILDCGDTICKRCVDSVKIDGNAENILCPLCSTKIHLTENNFPVNKYKESLLLIFDKLEKLLGKIKERKQCDEHETDNAHVFCYNCYFAMCITCERIHKRSPENGRHAVFKLNEINQESIIRVIVLQCNFEMSICKKHSTRNVAFWCLDCNTTVCEYCLLVEHSNHKRENLDDTVGRIRTEIENIRQSALKKLKAQSERDSVRENEMSVAQRCNEKAFTEFNAWFDTLSKILKDKKEKLEQEFEEEKQSQSTVRQNHYDNNQKLLSRMHEFCRHIEGIDSFASNFHKVLQINNIKTWWNSISNLPGNISTHISTPNVRFEPNDHLTAYLENQIFGQFTTSADKQDNAKTPSFSAQAPLPTRTFDSCLRVTGLSVIDKDTVVVVSHASTKCVGFDKHGKKKWEIRKKLKGPFDAVGLSERGFVYLLISDPGIQEHSTEGAIRIYKPRSSEYVFNTNLLSRRDFCPWGMCMNEDDSKLYVCNVNVREKVIEKYSIGQKFVCQLLDKYGYKENLASPFYVVVTRDLKIVVSDNERGVQLVSKGDSERVETSMISRSETFVPSKCCWDQKTGKIFVGNSAGSSIYVINMWTAGQTEEIQVNSSYGPIMAVESDFVTKRLWIAYKDGTIESWNPKTLSGKI